MREIKFRAWDGDRMLPVNNILFNKTAESVSTYGLEPAIIIEASEDKYGERVRLTGADIDTPLMQYIGLKDRNGVEIYEGDVVELKNYPDRSAAEHMQGIGAVEFSPALDLAYEAVKSNGNTMMLTWGGTESIEVIGNIYENHELLEEESR